MKTRFILFIAAIAGVALSCQKENNVITPEETPSVEISKEVGPNPNFVPTKSMTFVGTTDDEINAETKTSLDGNHIMWAVSDGIYLFDGTAPRAFTSTNGSVAATVNFEGNAVDAANYYSVYPSGKISTVGGKKVIATSIPTFQTATANTFAPKANVAVAYATSDPTGDGALQFKNIGAVVKFKINASNTDVCKVRLDAIGGQDLSGDINVTFESDGSFNTASVPAKSESCVILESATNLDPANTYYMAVKPGTYADGFKITLIRDDGSFRSINNKASITLGRNDLMDFGTLPEIPSWKAPVVDQLTTSTFGSPDKYTDWSGKSASSDATYAGNSTTYSTNAIQIRATSPSGIITTTSGGKAKKVVVDWNTGTTSGRTLQVYGKNTAYTEAANLYNDSDKGTLLGTIVYGTSTELVISGDYTYIGLRSASNTMYLNKISIHWGEVADPDKLAAATSITNISSESVALSSGSATFDVSSNVPWTIASDEDYASVSVDGDHVTVTFENLASGSRSATITVTPSEGTPVSQVFTQGAQAFTKHTGVLVEGDYVIVYEGKAMNTTVTSDRLQYENVTIMDNKITAPDPTIVWHVAPSGDYWTIYNAAEDKYAASTGAKNKAQILDSGTNDMSLWSVSSTVSSETYDFVNKKNTANKVNANLRNNGTYGFACYGSGTGGALTLYKK